jgi:hypothetical protein
MESNGWCILRRRIKQIVLAKSKSRAVVILGHRVLTTASPPPFRRCRTQSRPESDGNCGPLRALRPLPPSRIVDLPAGRPGEDADLL